MKTQNFFSTTAVATFLFVLMLGLQAQTMAQPPEPREPMAPFCQNIPNITDDQQKKIDALAVQHQKQMLINRDEKAAKVAEMRKLEHADKPDNAAINKMIDEIAALDAKIMKERNAHRQQIRALLTEEQRVAFDTQGGGRGQGRGHGCGQGCGQNCGKGQGFEPGKGRGGRGGHNGR